MLAAIRERLAACGLQLHPDKTRIVYCKDSDRSDSHEHESFDFLGYTFRPRKAKSKNGGFFVSFLPAVSDTAAKAARQQIRRWRLHLWTSNRLRDIAAFVNPIVRGWITYYGRFYRSRLIDTVLRQINEYLIRWAMRKYKRIRHSRRKAVSLLARIARSNPDLFAHWRLIRPGKTAVMGAG